jgi:hypothetical protein
MRGPRFLRSVLLLAIGVAGSTSALAQEKSDFTFAFHGYVAGSMYYQDQQVGPSNGQQAWYATTRATAHNQLFGGDVRTSRFNFSLAGPRVLAGAVPKGVLEFDFSNNAGPGTFGDASLLPRLRLAYAELNWGTTVVRFGQDHQLLLGSSPWQAPHVPASAGHLGYPLSYQAGEIGWRVPNIALYQNMPMGGGMAAELALMVLRSQWRAPIDVVATIPPPTSVAATAVIPEWSAAVTSHGEESGLPAVEARVQVASKDIRLFVAGHYGKVHRAGFGVDEGVSRPNDIDVIAGEAGARVIVGPVVVQAGGYTGKNLAPFVGDLVQFQADTSGDVHEWGAWGQLGFNFTPELSAWAFAGTSDPNDKDILNAGISPLVRLQNRTYSGMLRYLQGGFMVGLEWLHWVTNTNSLGTLEANQYMVTGAYVF